MFAYAYSATTPSDKSQHGTLPGSSVESEYDGKSAQYSKVASPEKSLCIYVGYALIFLVSAPRFNEIGYTIFGFVNVEY